MALLTLEGCGKCESALSRSRSLSTALTAGRITIDEYTYNLAISLVAACDEYMSLCVDDVPTQFLAGSFACLERLLKPVNFMPCPTPLIAGVASDEEIDQTKRRLKPKYVQLYQMVKKRVVAVNANGVEGRKGVGSRCGIGLSQRLPIAFSATPWPAT